MAYGMAHGPVNRRKMQEPGSPASSAIAEDRPSMTQAIKNAANCSPAMKLLQQIFEHKAPG